MSYNFFSWHWQICALFLCLNSLSSALFFLDIILYARKVHFIRDVLLCCVTASYIGPGSCNFFSWLWQTCALFLNLVYIYFRCLISLSCALFFLYIIIYARETHFNRGVLLCCVAAGSIAVEYLFIDFILCFYITVWVSSRVNDLSAVSVVPRGEKLIEALFFSACAAFLILYFISLYSIYLFSHAKTKNRFFFSAGSLVQEIHPSAVGLRECSFNCSNGLSVTAHCIQLLIYMTSFPNICNERTS